MKIKRVYANRIKHPTECNFYKHPSREIWLSPDDDRILTKEGFVEPSRGGEYLYYIREHLHVLKLETFLVKPTEKIKIWGNHIDGDKHNCKLSNLEWVTPSGNITHAFKSGLRTDNFSGFLMDLEDSKIYSFLSLREMANFLDINPGKVSRYLNGKRLFPLEFKYSCWLKGENPSKLNKSDIGKSPPGGVSTWKVKKINSHGDWIYFAQDWRLAKHLGLKMTKMLKLVKDGSGEYEGWEFEKIVDFEEHKLAVSEDKEYLNFLSSTHLTKTKKSPNKRVRVTNHLTGEITIYVNLGEFAKVNKFFIGEINRALKTKDSWNAFVFEFLE